MRNLMTWKPWSFRTIASVLMVCGLLAISSGQALAQKKGGGGGGGGGGAPLFQAVVLSSQSGSVHAMNNAVGGINEVLGTVDGQNICWKIDNSSGQAAVTSRTLVPATTGFVTYGRDINNQGVIVGHESGMNPENPDGVLEKNLLIWPNSQTTTPLPLPLPALPGDDQPELEDNQWDSVQWWVHSISDDGLIAGHANRWRFTDVPEATEEENYLVIWKYEIEEATEEAPQQVSLVGSLVVDTGLAWVSPKLSRLDGWLVYSFLSSDGSWVPVRARLDWEFLGGECELFFYRWELLVDGGQANVSDINREGIAVGYAIPGLDSQGTGYAMDLFGDPLTIPRLASYRLQGQWLNYSIQTVAAISDNNQVLSTQYALYSSGFVNRQRDVVSVLGGSSAIDLSTYTDRWVVWSARRINDNGWIAGQVYSQSDPSQQLPAIIIR